MNIKCSNCGVAFGSKCCPNCGMPAQQSMGHAKKKDNTKTVLTVLFSFVLFMLLITILININASQTNTSESTPIDNRQTESDNESSQGIPIDKSIKFGEEGKSENLILKVNKIGEKKEIRENEFFGYSPDSGKYAIVNITITNAGKTSDSLTSGYFKLISSDEAEYNPTMLIGLDNRYINFESINPGLEVTGNLVFEVPDKLSPEDMTLRFSGSDLFSKAIDFSLKK